MVEESRRGDCGVKLMAVEEWSEEREWLGHNLGFWMVNEGENRRR